jgi:hypothetical protein
MNIENGSRIIVATAEPIEVGERLTILPPHVRMMGWFSWNLSRTNLLEGALLSNFDKKPVLQNATIARPFWQFSEDRSRHVKGVERMPWHAVKTVVESAGEFIDQKDRHFDMVDARYVPLGRELPGRGRLHLPRVALFSVDRSTSQPIVVEAVAHTGVPRDEEAA